jgi:hypothetical protein
MIKQQTMDNLKILQSLEDQRDSLYKKLSEESVSGLYKKEYDTIKSGRLLVFDGKERQLLSALKQLSPTLHMIKHIQIN